MQREEKAEEGAKKEKTGLKPYQLFLQGCFLVCYLLLPFKMPNGVKIIFPVVCHEVTSMLLKTIVNQQRMGTVGYRVALWPLLGIFLPSSLFLFTSFSYA